jgi:hypothetical protein
MDAAQGGQQIAFSILSGYKALIVFSVVSINTFEICHSSHFGSKQGQMQA